MDIEDLLHRDGYQRVRGVPQVGDIAEYRDFRGEVEHTGLVCQVDMLGASRVIHVWSMWGSLGEFVHPAEISPYSKTVEYWRLQ